MSRNNVAWLSVVLSLLTGAVANAQWDPESGDTGQGWAPPPAEPTPPPQQPQPPPQQWGTPPPAEPAPPAQSAWGQGEEERPPGMGGAPRSGVDRPAAETDHDSVSFGISFFGLNGINVAPANLGGGALNLALPTVGIRAWFGTVGLDVGIGLGTTTRKTFNTCPGTNCDSERVRDGGINGGFGFGLHVGVPIAAAKSRHATFLIIPELGFAYGGATLFVPGDDASADIGLSAIQLDAGVRVGGELHFGAIGLPNLSLQLTIGLGLRYTSRSAENSVPNLDPSVVGLAETDLQIRTIANDLVNGTIRLNYYF